MNQKIYHGEGEPLNLPPSPQEVARLEAIKKAAVAVVEDANASGVFFGRWVLIRVKLIDKLKEAIKEGG